MVVERAWCSTEGKMAVVIGEVARLDSAWSMLFFRIRRGMTSWFLQQQRRQKQQREEEEGEK
jgi:hypothetical protein